MNPRDIHCCERQTFRQEPDCYDGKDFSQHRSRWLTSYPKEGDEEDGEVPVCPKCGNPADMRGGDGKRYRKWPNCRCGFSWRQRALNRYA